MAEYPINPKHNVFKKYRTVNYINSYVFAPPVDLTINTEIGGVASTISTPALLATKLAIDVSRINNFTIVGSDIKCKITGSYAIPNNAFDANTSINSYVDSDNLVTNIGNFAFRGTSSIKSVDFAGVITLAANSIFQNSGITNVSLFNCTSISNSAFFESVSLAICYIPKCTSLGSTAVNNTVFQSVPPTCKVYCNPYLATNNSGSPDGDLSAVSPVYVANFTTPGVIVNLSIGNIYATALQLNFTPPSSINAIDYYEVWLNGVNSYKRITSSGEYIMLLTASTSYSVELKPVDIYYNKSTSNSIVQSTNTITFFPTRGLLSHYKFDEITGSTAVDSYGSINLTNSGISVNQSGKINTAYASTASNQNLSATGAPSITGVFSLNIWCYRTAAPDAGNDNIFEQGDFGAGFGIWINGSSQIGYFVNTNFSNYSSLVVLPLNTWCMISLVYTGSRMMIYQDAVLKVNNAFSTNPASATTRRLFNRNSNSEAYKGRLDLASIFNVALSQDEITSMYNSGAGVTN